ncbi:hypothetical protein KIPB_008184, partial [Kipferlia bialata]|eukprot:g8184.t1
MSAPLDLAIKAALQCVEAEAVGILCTPLRGY